MNYSDDFEAITCALDECFFATDTWEQMVKHYRTVHGLTDEQIKEHEPI